MYRCHFARAVARTPIRTAAAAFAIALALPCAFWLFANNNNNSIYDSYDSKHVSLLPETATTDLFEARKALAAALCAGEDGRGKLIMNLHSGSQGLGVQLSSYVAAVSVASRCGLRFAFQGSWNYAGASACNASGWHCFFDQPAVCEDKRVADAIARDARSTRKKRRKEDGREQTKVVWEHAVLLGRTNSVIEGPTEFWPDARECADIKNGDQDKHAAGNVIVRPAHSTNVAPRQLSLGSFRLAWHRHMLQPPPAVVRAKSSADARWWEGQVAAQLFNPNRRVMEFVNKLKYEWGWQDGAVIGIHIRRRDRTDLLGLNVSDFIDRAVDARDLLRMKVNIHMTQLFIATDSPDFVQQSLQNHVSIGKTFDRVFMMPALPPAVSFGDYRWANDAPFELARATIGELELLAQTSVIIAAQRSMFAWQATRIQLGRGNARLCPRWITRPRDAYGFYDPSVHVSVPECV